MSIELKLRIVFARSRQLRTQDQRLLAGRRDAPETMAHDYRKGVALLFRWRRDLVDSGKRTRSRVARRSVRDFMRRLCAARGERDRDTRQQPPGCDPEHLASVQSVHVH
jgi:hypothetical protein